MKAFYHIVNDAATPLNPKSLFIRNRNNLNTHSCEVKTILTKLNCNN